MKDFIYNAPTKVLFGKGTEEKTAELIKEYFTSTYGKNLQPRVLVHYGQGHVVKSGLLSKIISLLDNEKIFHIELGGVVPNPHVELVRQAVKLCKENSVNFILAVGGGSVIDSSKAIGYALANPEHDVWEYYEKTQEVHGCYPVGAVLTISAAGSEMSNSSVITNNELKLKRGLNTEYSRCKFAVMNPELTMSLPAYQTASGAVDILMHTLERYFAPERSYITKTEPAEASGNTILTDKIAESLMTSVIDAASTLIKNPENYDARAEIMWASSLSHNGLTGCGGSGDWACHQMEHELGGMFDCAHGAGIAAIWATWARYVYTKCPERFAKFARNVMNISDNDSIEEEALAGISALENWFKSIAMPVSITELLGKEISEEEIHELAVKCSFYGKRKVGGFYPLSIEEMKAIYRAAK